MIRTASATRIRPKSLVRASLELGRVLADRNGLTFRAKGTCMYPTVRAGDILRIKSCRAADFSMGDIAVGRRPGYLFAHRVIGKGLEAGRAYVITRPDSAQAGSDGPMFDENLLGKVVAVERKGKPAPLQSAVHSRPMRGYFAVRRALNEAVPQLLAGLDRALAAVQAGELYQSLAKRWMTLARPRISYAVRLPMPVLGDAVYRELTPERFDARRDWRGRPVDRWILAMHLNANRRPAAWATFARNEASDWRVVELFVSRSYRGAGLDDKLLRQGDSILEGGPGP